MTNPIPVPDPATLTADELSGVITKLLGIQEGWVAQLDALPLDHPEFKEAQFLVGWVNQSREILRRALDGRLPTLDSE